MAWACVAAGAFLALSVFGDSVIESNGVGFDGVVDGVGEVCSVDVAVTESAELSSEGEDSCTCR